MYGRWQLHSHATCISSWGSKDIRVLLINRDILGADDSSTEGPSNGLDVFGRCHVPFNLVRIVTGKWYRETRSGSGASVGSCLA